MRSRSHPCLTRPAAVLTLALGTAVAVSAGPALALQASPETNPPGPVMAQGTRGAADPAPITPSTPDMKAVQDLLGRAAGAAVTPGHGRDLMKLLAKPARDRLAAGGPGDWSDVDAAAAAFAAAWQAKFGTSFKVDDKIPVVFTEPAFHVTGLESAASPPTTAPSADPSATPRKTQVTVVLTDPAHRGSVSLPLVNEGGDKPVWRFAMPDTATAATLHASLLRRLTAVTADQQRWPTDVDQAYVYVTQHLLVAVADAAAPKP